MFCRKNNRVASEVILKLMSEQEAKCRRDEGHPSVKNAWAPVLADSGTRLRDIRLECGEDDPQRVWRLETLLENERVRVARLETMLANEGSKASELQRRPPFDGSVLNVATDDDFGEEPPAASLATPSSSVPTTTRKRTLSDIEITLISSESSSSSVMVK
jgi:hypothetical protein